MMGKSLGNTAIWTAFSTLFKLLAGLLVVKLISVCFGTEGLGQAANFMTFITVLGVLSGGGIFNGITKYIAQYENLPEKTATLLATSSRLILFFSLLLAMSLILFSANISELLFFSRDFQPVIIMTALVQFGIAWSNYVLAILKGKRDARGYAVSMIVGTAIGVAAFLIGLFAGGYQGALLGFVFIPAFAFFPARYFLKKHSLDFGKLSGQFSRLQAVKLSRFSVMVFATALTLPIGYMILRDVLMQYRDLNAVGLWQGVSKISDAYLQFMTAAFSVHLLPTFAKLHQRVDVQREVWRAFRFIAIVAMLFGGSLYLLREWIILILYSSEFLAMKDLFMWQLLGDFCKVLAYIFGYLIVAKGAVKLYIAAEICQLVFLLSLGILLIPHWGEQGAVFAYFGTYFCYLMICLICFRAYLTKGSVQ